MATKKSPVKKTAPRKKKDEGGPISIEALKHDDKRVNIPTADLAARLSERVDTPPLLYPRDPSLDPQLVWKGKDLQDASDLSIPIVPIYIQEKIDPRIIVENLRETAKTPEAEPELTLFDDFDGFEGTQILEFYEHEGNWSNRMILGDSLLAMTSLAEKEQCRGKVQMVFIDPPYGIKFGSNWQVSTHKREVKDGNVADITRQPEQVKAFRDTWVLGIHSYLAYLRDRLVVARELLNETGSIFVQIGDENIHLVRSLLDEVFGPDAFVNQICFKKTNPLGASGLAAISDYVLWYAKDPKHYKYRQIFMDKKVGKDGVTGYTWVESPNGSRRRLTRNEIDEIANLDSSLRLFSPTKLTAAGLTPSCVYEFEYEGKSFRPPTGTSWRTNAEGMKRLIQTKSLIALGESIYHVMYYDDFPLTTLTNMWTDTRGEMGSVYVVQTARTVVERCMLMTTDPGDLVIDPTCGSGTTAYVAENWARRWITMDTSRVALALARTRLMSATFPYFMLSDSMEGREWEIANGSVIDWSGAPQNEIKRGFVLRRVPHITLKAVAQNPRITPDLSPAEARRIIEAEAEHEVLVDQPVISRGKVRVSGRFTVESLSPHRSLLNDANESTNDFASRILGHLKRAGVQNTYKGERLQFDRLDSYPGSWINGEGEYTDAEGKVKRVAVVIGPEHGTVSADIIRDAAIEAADGRGFDVLIVCGLAFDPLVGEQAKKFGRLVVLPTKINPDLTMPDGLLKNTGSGNLFTVFGEPDISISRTVDSKVVVKVNGVDVYDPTTGVVRSGTVNDIACWFIDSNYDQKSFFVRHAYFTGGNEPYEALAKTLRTEIDLEAWSALYSNESQPFDVPTTGRIAVKVINHFGDEVMQIYDVK
jgi:adenine-specific DNA-methyltransferase